MIRKIAIGLAALVVAAVVVVCGWLWLAPPELLRVADGYAAKIVCSNIFLAGREPDQVLAADVQAPGNPVLRLIRLEIDRPARIVTARMLGLFATNMAVYRRGLGCTAVPDGNVEAARKLELSPAAPTAHPAEALWPEGARVGAATDPKLADLLANARLAGPGMRAIVVVKDGRIVGETYAPGFSAETPLLGWSMTKTVTGLLIGRLMLNGQMHLDEAGLFAGWQGDSRRDITVRDLLAMASGLAFNEDYGDVSDATRMLYLEPDMARFAAAQPAVDRPGAAFHYSTGTGVMLARLWMDRIGDPAAALAFPRAALFGPLGMTSAVMETDEAGTLVGGSYMYATARDWARIGQLLLQDGVWLGQRLLPSEIVRMMGTSNGLPGGYSQALTWLEPEFGLPAGSFMLEGHDGQSVTVVPSAQLVVVRLGLTPSGLGYSPGPLLKAVLAATG